MANKTQTTLLNKLESASIGRPIQSIFPVPNANNSYATIGDLWEKFIRTKLPDKQTALAWHNVLMDYTQNCSDAIFAIRRGYPSRNRKEIQKYRGLFTKTDQGFSYFLADNEHAKYYLKLCLEGFVPDSADSLKNAYNTRKFPLTCFKPIKSTRALVDFPVQVQHGFRKSGYYLAHIYAVNQIPYCVKQDDGSDLLESAKKAFEKYFPSYGNPDADWIKTANDYSVRTLKNISPDAKRIVVAAFLRYVHPFNYFLTPQKARWRNDKTGQSTTTPIGEYKPLISFVQMRFADLYGKAYDDFRKLALIPSQASSQCDDNAEKVKINLKL